MIRKSLFGLMLALGVAAAAGCASIDDTGGDKKLGDLGPDMQEFETSAQGGVYRFQYVSEGADAYRTVFWRQGDLLSDDTKDAKLASDVVRTVFNSRFCKDAKKPVVFADGSPAPLGKIGLWSASLKCATPPPKAKEPKPEKAKPKEKPSAPSGETASDAKPSSSTTSEAKSEGETAEAKPKPESEAPAAKPKAKAASSTVSDGPMECKRVATGFECKPKK